MKGITPVIAVILLLMITVSMVGFAFVWFTRIGTQAAASVEQQAGQLQKVKTIRIENAKDTAVDIRNTGTINIDDTELSFYVDNTRVTTTAATCGVAGTDTIAPNALISCTLPSACPTGTTLRVTVTGGEDIFTCK